MKPNFIQETITDNETDFLQIKKDGGKFALRWGRPNSGRAFVTICFFPEQAKKIRDFIEDNIDV